MKYCQECHQELKKKYQKKFCSRSCSAKNSNKKRVSKKSNLFCQFCKKSLRGRSGKKFCSSICDGNSKSLLAFQSGNSSPRNIRTHLLKTREYKCEICQITHWLGKPINLEVDHIDGNSQNNNENNLRLLCPNCHSYTPTFRNKNHGNGRYFRRQRYKEGKSY